MNQAPSQARVSSVLSVLNRYEKRPLPRLDGFTFLKALTSGKRKRGIFILGEDLTREVFKLCIKEAIAAGIDHDKLYIYGRLGIYSGRSIEFTKFADLGL
jgi:hypothetical protein